MFATIGRSWEFAKISYGILWDYKGLVIFPILSTIAAVLVMASFIAPLWAGGTLEQWMALLEDGAAEPTTADQVAMYAMLFAFYFCTYFVMVFFNCALTACAMQVVNGEEPSLGYGLSMASKRIPQIAAWAFLSAVIGVLLKAIENVNEKIGAFVAAILGSAWTALTYFVVPVLVMEGVGPVTAIKQSVGTLKKTWGKAFVGHFSLGFLAFLILLPILLVVIAIGYFGGSAGMMFAIPIGLVLIVIATAVTSTADGIFKAILYNYATGKSVPDSVDTSAFADAFAPKA